MSIKPLLSSRIYINYISDLDGSVTGEHIERDDDDELISDEDEDDDEDYDKYPDPDYLIGHKKRRNSETSELSRGSAAEDESQLVNGGEHSSMKITNYHLDPKREVFGDAGDQTEEISDENKSIVWFLVKQVRPGMDLSKVVLPTFILEPRSFLDKLSDYYYHADILSM